MRWSVKDILVATTAVVLVLVARQMVADYGPWGQQKFFLALYIALVVVAGVLAIFSVRELRGVFLAYSVFCTLYYVLCIRGVEQVETAFRLGLVGILLGVACAFGVGLVLKRISGRE